MNSVRNRLALLFFVITAAAVGFIYLYVVPQLRSSLTAEKLRRLEQVAGDAEPAAADGDASAGSRSRRLRALVRGIDQRTGSRVTVLGLREGAAGPAAGVRRRRLGARAHRGPAPPIPRRPLPRTPDRVASAVESVGGERIGETAVALADSGRAALGRGLLDRPRRRRRQRRPDPPPDPDRRADRAARGARRRLPGRRAPLAAPAPARGRRPRRWPTATSRTRSRSTPSDEVGQLAITFNEMQKRLATLDSARKEFIANASHELRTPIFSLSGFVELLEDDDPDPEARAEFVRTMRGQVERLTKLDRRPARPLEARRRRDRDPPRARRAGRPGAQGRGRVRPRCGSSPVADHGRRGAGRRGERRPGQGRSDPAYPDRQRTHAHAGGNRDLGRGRIRERDPPACSSPTTGRGSSRARATASSSASTPATRSAAPGSGSRSRASWRGAWTARSRSARAAAAPSSSCGCRRPRPPRADRMSSACRGAVALLAAAALWLAACGGDTTTTTTTVTAGQSETATSTTSTGDQTAGARGRGRGRELRREGDLRPGVARGGDDHLDPRRVVGELDPRRRRRSGSGLGLRDLRATARS